MRKLRRFWRTRLRHARASALMRPLAAARGTSDSIAPSWRVTTRRARHDQRVVRGEEKRDALATR